MFKHKDVLKTLLETFDITRLSEKLHDGDSLSAWVAVPLAVLGDIEAALVVDVGEVAGALYIVSLGGRRLRERTRHDDFA